MPEYIYGTYRKGLVCQLRFECVYLMGCLIGNATYARREIDLTHANLAWMTDVILITDVLSLLCIWMNLV